MSLGLSEEYCALHLRELESQFNAGRNSALLSAIRFCGDEKIVMPEWVVNAFFKATNRWFSMQTKTLDEAFGLQFPKGLHFAAVKKKYRLKHAVYAYATQLIGQGRNTDAALFTDVGNKFNIGKTLAEQYYYSVENNFSLPAAVKALLKPFKAK